MALVDRGIAFKSLELPGVIVVVVVLLCAVNCTSTSSTSAADTANQSSSKDPTISARDKQFIGRVNDVDELLAAGDWAGAEALIDQYSSDPALRNPLSPSKLKCLVHRSAKSEAVELAVAILNGQYGIVGFATKNLRLPVDFSVELDRGADTQTIAAGILRFQSGQFSEFAALQTPREEANPTNRLAYSYLVVANDLNGEDADGEISYCQKARDLLPSNPMVLIRYAAALGDRGSTEDRQLAKSYLIQAYNSAPAGSELRTAAQDFAHRYGLGDIP